MAAFLDITVNGKQRSGEFILVQRDPATGLFPMSAKMDGEADAPELVPKVPHEPALELTGDGLIEGLVYVRSRKSGELKENAVLPIPEAITGENVDGLMAFPAGMCLDTPGGKPIKALRGRPRLSEDQKRLAASERQARWRRNHKAVAEPPDAVCSALAQTPVEAVNTL
jgi:hypothetical protein